MRRPLLHDAEDLARRLLDTHDRHVVDVRLRPPRTATDGSCKATLLVLQQLTVPPASFGQYKTLMLSAEQDIQEIAYAYFNQPYHEGIALVPVPLNFRSLIDSEPILWSMYADAQGDYPYDRQLQMFIGVERDFRAISDRPR